MEKVFFIVNNAFDHYLKQYSGFEKLILRRSNQSIPAEASALIVQREHRGFGNLGCTDGISFIQKLRVYFDCELPILLLQIAPSLQSHRDEGPVSKDPYIRTITFSELPKYNSPQAVLDRFDLLPAEERHLLFQELRHTIYKDTGYIDDVWHQVSRLYGQSALLNSEYLQEQLHANFVHAYKLIPQKVNKLEIMAPQVLFDELKSNSFNEESYKIAKSWLMDIHKAVDQNHPGDDVKEKEEKYTLIYISDAKNNQSRFADLFAEIQFHYYLNCLCVSSYEEAYEQLSTLDHTIGVISDYRFMNPYDSSGRYHTLSGLLVIRRLQQRFPNKWYGILTSYPLWFYEDIPIPHGTKIYEKDAIYTPENKNFAMLALELNKFRDTIIASKDRFPIGDESWDQRRMKINALWDKWYKKLVKSKEYPTYEKKIRTYAKERIKKILNHQEYKTGLNCSKPLGALINEINDSVDFLEEQKEQQILKGLIARLKLRRLYLGLIQIDLSRRIDEKEKQAIGLVGHSSDREKMELAYYFTHGKRTLNDKSLSNHYGYFRLFLTESYYFENNQELEELITHAEFEWIAKNAAFFAQFDEL